MRNALIPAMFLTFGLSSFAHADQEEPGGTFTLVFDREQAQ
jgi:hypothetical protein